MTTGTTAQHNGSHATPAAVIARGGQGRSRRRTRAMEPPAHADGAKSLPAASAGARRGKSSTIPVPPLDECLTKDGTACKIPIAGGGVALIDAADYHLIAGTSWHWGGTKCAYPVSRSKLFGARTTYLHRRVMQAKPSEKVDHKDGERRADCRKSNLRKATPGQNAANRGKTRSSTGFCGVSFYPGKARKPYKATLMCNGKTFYGPYRARAKEAARDYDALARTHHGAFATLNFPNPGERRCEPVGPALEARRRASAASSRRGGSVAQEAAYV